MRTAATVVATGCPATDAGNLALAGTIHNSDVVSPETWTLAGSPHRLPDGLRVGEGGTLTLEPCVRVIVADGRNITVDDGGTLIAEGTADHPITFGSGSATPQRGVWAAMFFNPHARVGSKLHYVNIEESGGDGSYPAAIFVQDAFVLDVQHVRIVRSKRDGVFMGGSSRFAQGSLDLVVTESGIAEELSAPVHFSQANSVGSLPPGTYVGNVTNEIVVDGHDVTASATWRNPGAGVRYRLLDGLTVEGPTGAVLTVEAGTTLAFAEGKTLWVGWGADGAIVLDGTADTSRITLTSARPLPDAGDWAGVMFGDHVSRAATKLAFVTIEFAGNADGYDDVGCGDAAPAAITINGRDLGPRIDHVSFRSLPPNAFAIARNFSGDGATDYTVAAMSNDFAGGQRCKQSLNRDASGGCPDPIPVCH